MKRKAILLIAHGSRRPEANEDLFRLAQEVSERSGIEIVEPSFLELAEPTIREAGRRCVRRGAKVVFIIPYFLSLGMHVTRDLAEAHDKLAADHDGIQFELGRPLGPDPLLRDLVIRRVDEQVAREHYVSGSS